MRSEWELCAYFIGRSQDLTEGRLASTLHGFAGEEDSWVPGYEPKKPEWPALTTVKLPKLRLRSMEIGVSSAPFELPGPSVDVDGLCWFQLSTLADNLMDDPEKQDAFFEIALRFFETMGALFGFLDHLYNIQDATLIEEYLRGYHPVHLFHEELANHIGREELEQIPGYGVKGSTIYIRFLDQYVMGMPVDFVPMMRGPVDRTLHFFEEGKATTSDLVSEPLPRVPLGEREAIPGRPGGEGPAGLMPNERFGFFFWFYHPKENHTKEACRDLYLDLIDVKDPDRYVDFEGGLLVDFSQTPIQREGDAIGVHVMYDIPGGRKDGDWTPDGTDVEGEKTRIVTRKIAHLFMGHLKLEHEEFFPTKDPPLKNTNISATFLPTSGFPMFGSLGPEFERQGSVSMMLATQGSFGTMERRRDEEVVNELIELVIRRFKPTFGFGHIDFNWFAENYRRTTPFEDRLWPLCVYSPETVSKGLVKGLKRTLKKSGISYRAKRFEDGTLLLIQREHRRSPRVLEVDGSLMDM